MTYCQRGKLVIIPELLKLLPLLIAKREREKRLNLHQYNQYHYKGNNYQQGWWDKLSLLQCIKGFRGTTILPSYNLTWWLYVGLYPLFFSSSGKFCLQTIHFIRVLSHDSEFVEQLGDATTLRHLMRCLMHSASFVHKAACHIAFML